MDGDNDIVVGHNYSSQTQWSGISILLNDGAGHFFLHDSVFLYSGQSDVLMQNFNNLPNKEIIASYIDSQTNLKFVAVINDFNLADISYLPLNTLESINDKAFGDVNGDGNMDIVIASHDGLFWGVLYSDGIGNFSFPEFNYVSDYFPTELTCGNLNGDNRDDVVVCGQSTEVYFSYPTGFQLMVLETNNYKEGASITDFDLDGDNDLLTFTGNLVGDVSCVKFFENLGNNIFDTLGEVYFQHAFDKFLIADFDNDSLQDILFQLTNHTGYIIYYNKGNFQLGDSLFVPLPPSNPEEGWRNCYSEDMDGNGYFDIISIKTLYVYLPDNLVILFNDGNGNFVENPITSINESMTVESQQFTCYPNPFFSETNIKYQIKESSFVDISVYTLSGELIKVITHHQQKGGIHSIKWDGLDNGGKPCKSGPHLLTCKVNGMICKSTIILKY
jgi:hypothetical protein